MSEETMTRADAVQEYVSGQFKSHVRSVQEMRDVLSSIEARLLLGRAPSTVDLAALSSKVSHFTTEASTLIGRSLAAGYIDVK